ncbi:MAG TPA: hypothetical protein VFE61_00600 [Candidatus Sulfotelmatobacter sp.]|jgi:hypothetical protein|nr:hypothetical protein [Candidatus Sulfotelmatobacter sp.]
MALAAHLVAVPHGGVPAPDGGTEQAQTATNQPAITEISVLKPGKNFLLGPFTLTVELDSDNCWVVKGQTSAALLRHEQVHWDIAGLTAYEISRTLKALRVLHVPGLKAEVDATMKRLATKAQALQFW